MRTLFARPWIALPIFVLLWTVLAPWIVEADEGGPVIQFPPTSVGQTSTQCTSFCFTKPPGSALCDASGTVDAVVITPSPPFTLEGFVKSASSVDNSCSGGQPVQFPASVDVGQEFYVILTFSPVSAGTYPGSIIFSATHSTVGPGVDSIDVCGATPDSDSPCFPDDSGKDLGDCHDGSVDCGDPIDLGSGNVFLEATDYSTSGQNTLSFQRFYNSRALSRDFAKSLGSNWRSNYDGYLHILGAGGVAVERPTGQGFPFVLRGSTWVSDSDLDYRLTQTGTGVGSIWTLSGPNDRSETYTTIAPGEAVLTAIRNRNGYTITIARDEVTHNVVSVTDSYGRSLECTYDGDGRLIAVTTPDGTTVAYAYDGNGMLAAVTFPTSPAGTVTYTYGGGTAPSHAVTRLTDESGNVFSEWTYDAKGRAVSNALGGAGLNANRVNIVYDDTTGSRTVTNALGATETYTFASLQGVPKVTRINRAATPTTVAATRTFAYDSKGFLASETDWNGNLTTYIKSDHGLPVAINEAVGSAVARTTTIEYDPTFVHLPTSIATPGLTARFTYDASGNVLTRTLVDTTMTTSPYSTNGQARTWTNTWSNFLLDSTTTPNGSTTNFRYDNSGALVSTTNALNHTTTVTSHTEGGLPESIVDPNSVTTVLSYDARQRLLSSTVSTSAEDLATSYTYFLNGDVTTTSPDGSSITSLHDQAHRLVGYADFYDNQIDWTLDALGDETARTRFDPSGGLRYFRTANFDALGRQLTDRSSATGQAWTYAYDKNGNAVTLTDPLNHTTNRVFDALNRLTASADANGGVVQYTYDAHDQPLTIKDKNRNVTSYVYDGFGDVIQQVSPDSGTTVYHYDPDGNRIQMTDASGTVSHFTYDALDRILTTTYPADAFLNIAYTYDETGTLPTFGFGRLTSIKDAAGSLTRTYDERGNLLVETRTSGAKVLTTAYTYDKAGRIASITYPSGAVSSYTRDRAGNIVQMPFMAVNSGQAFSLLDITHLPFGPVDSLRYSNGDTAAFTFDQDYRLCSLVYKNARNAPYFTWLYRYDAANNVTSITDQVKAANSQTFGYDVLNRLTSAKSTGTYGSLAWAYDKNGNLVTRKVGKTAFVSTYLPGTNRLAATTWQGNRESFSYTPTGNISKKTLNGKTEFTAVYSKANRLASVTGTPLAISSAIYDWRGKRFSKGHPTSSPTLYTYDQEGNLLEENTGGKITDYIYLDGINVANWAPSEKHLYAINFDRLGVPLLGRDKYGLTNWSAYSQPYGAMTITKSMGKLTGPVTQNLRLPGQYFDRESGFHYNGARDYVPSLGRYLEADPIGLAGGLNPYLYAEGNPFEVTDPTGSIGLSMTGAPGSWAILPSNGQVRYYDGNGNPSVDLDFSHSHEGMCPHAHNWCGSERDWCVARFSPVGR